MPPRSGWGTVSADGDLPAVVAGAGPVGLAAALALRRLGHEVIVLEAEPRERPRAGSRAIYVHGATLRLLEGVSPGLGHAMAERGVVWSGKRTFWKGRQIYGRHYAPPAPGRLPHFTSLPQVVSDRLLLDACEAMRVQIAWSTPLRSLTADRDGVTVLGAGREWRARYVVGADGARSAVRQAIGVSMSGPRPRNAYVVVDVADDPSHPLPCERVFHYLHPGVGHRNVLLVPFAGGWRVDLQCRVDDDLDHLATPDGVRSWLVEVLLPGHSLDVTWVSTYRFLQVVAERFTDEHRRVLLAGEAAHLFAPFGARGMNSGIADAVAAARAIHLALQEGDPQSRRRVIDGLSGDRRASALYNRDAAGKALRHMQASDPWIRVTRAVAARLARRSCRVGAWMDSAPYGPRRGRVGMTSAKY